MTDTKIRSEKRERLPVEQHLLYVFRERVAVPDAVVLELVPAEEKPFRAKRS